MNLLLLLFGFRVWSGSPLEMLTRALCALSLLALEMQLATWSGVATLTTVRNQAGAGASLCISVGGRTDKLHGEPYEDDFTVVGNGSSLRLHGRGERRFDDASKTGERFVELAGVRSTRLRHVGAAPT